LLKHINTLITPEMMKCMMEMGHGEELIITDGNFPAITYSQKIIHINGVEIQKILSVLLYYFPLDYRFEKPVTMMECPKELRSNKELYQRIINESNKKETGIEMLPRQEFYDRAKKSVLTIVTSDFARFANVILRKGIITEEDDK